MLARIQFPFALALVLALSLSCGDPVDIDALIADSISLGKEMDQIEIERDSVLVEVESTWDRVQKGPQMMLNVWLDIAASDEARGWTIEAEKVRQEAYAEFEADPLVIEAKRLLDRHDTFDALWLEKNKALLDILIALQDANATDQWREAAIAAGLH